MRNRCYQRCPVIFFPQRLLMSSMPLSSLLSTLVMFAKQASAYPRPDTSTLFVDAAGFTCPASSVPITYLVQPVVFSAYFTSTAVIDPFQNCNYITISDVPADVFASTLLTTTISPGGLIIEPLTSTSCLASQTPTTATNTVSSLREGPGKPHTLSPISVVTDYSSCNIGKREW